MTKPYKELTPPEMIDVALRFHPKINPADYVSNQQFTNDYWKSPERRALTVAQDQASEQIKEFHALVQAVSEALPAGSYVNDLNIPGHDPSYRVLISPAGNSRSSEEEEDPTLVVYVSFLIPYYAYYEAETESERQKRRGRRKPLPPLFEIGSELKPVAERVEREIAKRYGYYRFPAELTKLRLANVFIDGAPGYEPTLFEAFFTAHWW